MEFEPGDLLSYNYSESKGVYILEFVKYDNTINTSKRTFTGKLIENTHNSAPLNNIYSGYTIEDFTLHLKATRISDLVSELLTKLDKLY